MTGQVVLTGIVLTTMPVGDYDRRITILTKERGNITVFAKGARRPTSAFLGCSQPFSFGEFTLFEGKNAYNLVSADIKNYFSEIRNDISAIYYGMYFCEFTNYMIKENMECKSVLNLLYLSLKALSNTNISNELVRDIFELKFLTYSGEMPQVFECVSCGAKKELKFFSQSQNGVLCPECVRNFVTCEDVRESFITINQILASMEISESALYTLQFIAATPLKNLFSFKLSDEVQKEVSFVIQNYTKKHVAHEMKSLELVEVFS